MRKFGADLDDFDDDNTPPLVAVPQQDVSPEVIQDVMQADSQNPHEAPGLIVESVDAPTMASANDSAKDQSATPRPLVGQPLVHPVKLRPRYRGDQAFNNMVRADWVQAIVQDWNAYDALIYLPSVAVRPEEDKDDYEQAKFTEINNNQRELTYSDPSIVTLLDCPDQRDNFTAVDHDGEQNGLADDFLSVRVAATGIPIGSVFEWQEELASGEVVRRWWYCMKILSYGTASVGSLYCLVPARNFEGTNYGETK